MMRHLLVLAAMVAPVAAQAQLVMNGAVFQSEIGVNQLSMTETYDQTFTTGGWHQTSVVAKVTKSLNGYQLWNNYDSVTYNVTGGDPAHGDLVTRYEEALRYTNAPNVPQWAGIDSIVDFTGNKSSVSGPILGREIDIEAAGVDDQTAFGSSRVALAINAFHGRAYGGTDSVVARGINLWTDPSIAFDRAIQVNGRYVNAAIDVSGAVSTIGAPAIRLADGQAIAFHNNVGGVGNLQYAPSDFGGAGAIHAWSNVMIGSLLGVQGQAGVSCSGPPTASFAVVSGLIVHC